MVHFSGDELFAQLIENKPLYGSLDRSCAVDGVVTFFGDKADGIVSNAQFYALLYQHLVNVSYLEPYDLFNIVLAEVAEVYDVVDTVEELGTNLLP